MAKLINSTSNQEIKRIHRLNEKKFRDETGLFFVEGIRPVLEAFKQKAGVSNIIYCPEILRSQVALDFITQFSANQGNLVLQVNEKVFGFLAHREGPQGLAAVIRQRWDNLVEIEKMQDGVWIGLDSIQDPGNLGSILRTMDAVGGKGVLLLDKSTDVYHPTAIRASMGAVFTQKIIKIERDEFIDWKKKNNIPCFGSTCEPAVDYQSINYPGHSIILMGSEQKGLNKTLLEICDRLIHIPMRGQVDSLNLSNAASVILYEVYNQRRKKG
jgi:TrmH family RNA methyltransferase